MGAVARLGAALITAVATACGAPHATIDATVDAADGRITDAGPCEGDRPGIVITLEPETCFDLTLYRFAITVSAPGATTASLHVPYDGVALRVPWPLGVTTGVEVSVQLQGIYGDCHTLITSFPVLAWPSACVPRTQPLDCRCGPADAGSASAP